MKILALADRAEPRLWEHLDRRLLDHVDLVLSSGDLPAAYLSFLTCFTHAPVLYVHGNHDIRYETAPPEGCICVDGLVYRAEGLNIMGLGGSMRYKPEAPLQYSEKEMARRARKLRLAAHRAGGVDILLTHAPARGVGDEEGLAHRGFETFLTLMDRYKPLYMIHGHVHAEYTHDFRRERQHGVTTVVNAYGFTYITIEESALRARQE